MIVELIPILSLRFKKVQYYTVWYEGRPHSEFRDFILRMQENKRNAVELAEINRYIERIGEDFGAWPQHFKTEDAAEGLPPPYYRYIESDDSNDFGLRLYCIRLTPGIVILVNGDRKTSLKVQDCKKCYPYFDRTRRISKKIDQAIMAGYIKINRDENEIEVDWDFDIEI